MILNRASFLVFFVLLHGAFALASTPSAISSATNIIEDLKNEHRDEINKGISIFGPPAAPDLDRLQYMDDDFVSYSVGPCNSGPEEHFLKNGHCIYQTKAPVFTAEECQALVAEAKGVIKKGLESEPMQGERPSNSQLGEARVSQLPIAREWLRHVLHTRLFPLLESRFGIQAQDLTLQDSLIIGYGYFGKGAESQPVHRDSSLLSLTVALSPSTQYTGGGGTYFEGLDQVLFSEQGHVICHASGTPHAGRGIASGCERYVLVLFVLCKDNPELARRCRAQGIRLGEEGKHEEAKLAFETGLELAPKDHLLWISLGSVYMQQGNFLRARACLSTAASCYPYCLRSAMGLARMHLENRKPRAALRRFNRVLDWLNDRDLRDDLEWKPWRQFGWEARVFGSQAALVCAQEAKRANMQDFDCKTNIELAKTRLRATLQTGQDDVRTLGLLKFADSLQDDINEPT